MGGETWEERSEGDEGPGRAMTPRTVCGKQESRMKKRRVLDRSIVLRNAGPVGMDFSGPSAESCIAKGLSSLGHLVAGWKPPVGSMTLAQTQ